MYAALTEALNKYGCKRLIVLFVSRRNIHFNLDGAMIDMTVTSFSTAQADGLYLDIGMQIAMLLVLMLTGDGVSWTALAAVDGSMT